MASTIIKIRSCQLSFPTMGHGIMYYTDKIINGIAYSSEKGIFSERVLLDKIIANINPTLSSNPKK